MNVAVVTGISSGIGKATTKLLLENGWKVYGLSRSRPDIQNDRLIWIHCDLTQPYTITDISKKIEESSIDLFLSNAGVAFEEPASMATQESYTKMFEVNVLAPILLVHALRERILHATIISISSVSDRIAEKDFALYCSSKAANTRYFESLAQDLKEAKIFCLLPDYVDTPMLRKLQAGRDFNWEGTIKVEDIANLITELVQNKYKLESGSNIIVVTNSLVEDLKNFEKLYGFNTDTGKMAKL